MKFGLPAGRAVDSFVDSALLYPDHPGSIGLIVLGSGYQESVKNAVVAANVSARLGEHIGEVVLTGGGIAPVLGAQEPVREAEVMREAYHCYFQTEELEPPYIQPFVDTLAKNTYEKMLNGLEHLGNNPDINVVGVIGRSAHARRAVGVGRIVQKFVDGSESTNIIAVQSNDSPIGETTRNHGQFIAFSTLALNAGSLADTDRANRYCNTLFALPKRLSGRYRPAVTEK